MEPVPGPSLREWIVITVLFLIFFWCPMLFFAVDAHKPYLLYREPPPSVEWGMRSEAVYGDGRYLVFYYFDFHRHAFAYFDVVVEDGRDIRSATFSEFILLENSLRPHREAEK